MVTIEMIKRAPSIQDIGRLMDLAEVQYNVYLRPEFNLRDCTIEDKRSMDTLINILKAAEKRHLELDK